MAAGIHKVYAIRYGQHDRKSSENYIGGDKHDVLEPLDYFVWVILGDAGAIVVDMGFNAATAKRRGRKLVRPVEEGLKAIGVDPADVQDVIVTHMHFDHVGNHRLFARARYHLQDREMAFATGRCMCHQQLRAAYDPEDVAEMVKNVFASRVQFHDGNGSIAPGVAVHRIGGHTMGLQAVTVETARGTVVLASDAAHLYSHIETGRVFPIVYNVAELLEGFAELRRLAPTLDHIIPGHDPLVMKRYPAAARGLENWIVQLDAAPGVN